MVKLDGVVVYAEGGYCGFGPKMSNNVAEYQGFCAALREALKYEGEIYIRGDSRLVICQLNRDAAKRLGYAGKWKSKGGLYMPFFNEAVSILNGNEARIKMDWIPREKNDECDYLSKDILKQRGIIFRIQPEAA